MVSTKFNVELRSKTGALKAYLTPFVSKCTWEWNRIGGCGQCNITLEKGYRDIIFDARDDIQIRIKDGATTKLFYRGFIANIIPTLQIGENIQLQVRGYYDLMKKIVVQSSGGLKTYTSLELSAIVGQIAGTFVYPNTPIVAGTIEAGTFIADSLQFLTNVENALATISELYEGAEYGVDANLKFFWYNESETITHKFFVGDNVEMLERRVKWDDLVNRIYLVGGDVSGTQYRKTGESTDSQALYYLAEDLINNGSITTNTVANQYIGSKLRQNSNPLLSIRAKIVNTNKRLEDTLPIGRISFYDATYDQLSAGDLIGDIIGATSLIGTNSVANPTVLSCINHGFITGELVVILGNTGGTPALDGSYPITKINNNSFSIAVNASVSGTGGYATAWEVNGSDIRIGLVADTYDGGVFGTFTGDDVIVGGEYSAQVDRIQYELSNTDDRVNITLQFGDTVLETSAKIKRLELALANINQY
jgi:hypothetical protein